MKHTSSSPTPARRGRDVRAKAAAGVAAAGLAAAGLLALHPGVSQAAQPQLNSNALYVAPNGSDSAAGTEAAPTTLTSAISKITAGGTIYMRGGTYSYAQTVTIADGNNGSSGALKELSAYPGEKPVLDFSAQAENSSNRGLALMGSYWHVYGITVQRAGDNGIYVGGSHNVIERTVTAFNHDTGLQLGRIASTTPQDKWPSDNLVISAESHDNADSGGENADGFAAKLTVGTGNVFRYDVSHNNIDDGWDLYTKTDTGPIGPVTIEDSLSYDNGTLSDGTQAGSGDRNGFKLGGEDIPVDHIVLRNIAYNNGHHGFTYNSNPGHMTISDNVSIDSTERNYSFDAGTSVFRGNTSCRSGSGSNDKVVGDADSSNQFWSGTNGSRCSSYSGALNWSFASDGRLVVTFGGQTPPTSTPPTTPTTPPTSTPPTTPTTPPTSTPPTTPPAGGTLLSDDFEDGNANGWATTGGSWAVRSTGSHVLTQSTLAGTAVALAGSSSWTSQSVQASVTPTLFDGSGEYVAVLARAKDASDYYALVLRDANKAEIRRVSGGTTKVLASVSFTVGTGVPYTVRLSAQGSTLTGYVNGQSVVSASDSTFTSGMAGLSTYQGTADFDNVVVTSS